jgi:hypothetical protein
MIPVVIIILITIAVELFIGLIIILNPNKFENKPDTIKKLFVFVILSVMIISLTGLTIAGIKG